MMHTFTLFCIDNWPIKRLLKNMTWISRGGPRALWLSLACCCCYVQGISREHWVIGPVQPIVALPGDDITLPCHLLPATDVSSMTVEWSKGDLAPTYIHVLQDGREMFREMNPLYRDRTALFTERLEEGNVSLKLSRVKLSDEGLYRCLLPSLESQVTECFVQLHVGKLSQPAVSVVGVGIDAVVLKCEVKCWHSVPEIEWSQEGRVLTTNLPDKVDHPDDGFTVYQSHVTVERSATNRFTCKVKLKTFNQIMQTVIEVSDDLFLTRKTCDCAAAWSLLGVLILVVLAVLCYKLIPKKKCGKPEEPDYDQSINTMSETEDSALLENQRNEQTSNTRRDGKTVQWRDEDGDEEGSNATLKVPGTDDVFIRRRSVSQTPPLCLSSVQIDCTPPVISDH